MATSLLSRSTKQQDPFEMLHLERAAANRSLPIDIYHTNALNFKGFLLAPPLAFIPPIIPISILFCVCITASITSQYGNLCIILSIPFVVLFCFPIIIRHVHKVLEKDCAIFSAAKQHNSICICRYDHVLKASHAFNILDARGAVGVTERARFFGRMRK